jgi:hypothetical protein
MKKLDKLNSPITDDSVKEDFDREKIDQVRSGTVTISIMPVSIGLIAAFSRIYFTFTLCFAVLFGG